jgi:hypothetical protein
MKIRIFSQTEPQSFLSDLICLTCGKAFEAALGDVSYEAYDRDELLGALCPECVSAAREDTLRYRMRDYATRLRLQADLLQRLAEGGIRFG